VENYATQAESNLKWLHEQLREEKYQPRPVRRHWIPKPGSRERRPLGIPTVRDRIVQGALRNVLEPIFERRFVEQSHGFRPGRSCKDALRRVDALLCSGHVWVVDADIQAYFDNIDRQRLMQEVRREVGDGQVLALLEKMLEQPVMEGMKEWTAGKGTPQGAVISPLLANIFLHPADVAIVGAGFELVRYADDLVILCESEARAQQALELLAQLLTERGLVLHPDKTRIVAALQPGGFDFLGYHFEMGRMQRTPRTKSLKKLKDAVRARTPRNGGQSLAVVITGLNRILRGWFEYFKHCHRWTFERLDRWVRVRLRRMLTRRRSHRAKGRRSANRRWPNAFFVEHGLFMLEKAHAAARPSR
jgi:RNA-directed DNA polymerase